MHHVQRKQSQERFVVSLITSTMTTREEVGGKEDEGSWEVVDVVVGMGEGKKKSLKCEDVTAMSHNRSSEKRRSSESCGTCRMLALIGADVPDTRARKS